MQPCVIILQALWLTKLKNGPPEGLGEYFEQGLISALTAAPLEQRPAAQGMVEKKIWQLLSPFS